MSLTALPLLLFTALFLFLTPSTAQNSSPSSTCSTFEWNEQPSFLRYSEGGLGGPSRVSRAFTCGPNGDVDTPVYCPMPVRGRFNTYFLANVSQVLDDSTTSDYWHNLVYSQVQRSIHPGTTWNYTRKGGNLATTVPIPVNISAYANFTQLFSCYIGTLRGCSGSIQEGTILEACCPVYQFFNDGVDPILDGLYTVVNISESNVWDYQSQAIDPLVGVANRGDPILATSRCIIAVMAILVVSLLSLSM